MIPVWLRVFLTVVAGTFMGGVILWIAHRCWIDFREELRDLRELRKSDKKKRRLMRS